MKSPRSLSKNQIKNYLIFLILFVLYSAVTLFLFHRQSVSYEGNYTSDMLPYIAHMRGQETGYDFPYPILFWTGRLLMVFFSPAHAMALAVAGLNALTALALKGVFDGCLEVGQKDSLKRGIAGTAAVFAMLLISMLYPLSYLGKTGEPLEYLRYKGVFSPNPYHNATFLAARPFMVVSFLLLADLLNVYEKEEKRSLGKYIAFSAALLLSTMAKPSFTLAAVSTAGVIMLWRLFCGKCKKWKAFFKLGFCFIPTFGALLYQFRGVFMGGSAEVEKGIGIGFLQAWRTASDNIPVALALGLCFPLIVLIFHVKEIRDKEQYRFSWQLLVMSVAQLALLYEKGYRLPHLNFAWGYMCAMFLVCLMSLVLLIQDSAEGRGKVWKLCCQWGIFALHLVCGVDYFRVLLSGGLFL